MTFSKEAAELHRIEAAAISLGLTEAAFEPILREVTAQALVAGNAPTDTLTTIRNRVHEAARWAMPTACATDRALADAVG